MKKSKYSEAQIATAFRQVEAGAPIAEVTRKLGVSEQTYYLWRKRYGQMGVARDSPAAAAGRGKTEAQATGGRPDPG